MYIIYIYIFIYYYMYIISNTLHYIFNKYLILFFIRSLANNPTYIVVINLGLRQETVNLTSVYPNLKDPVEIIIASSNAVNIT